MPGQKNDRIKTVYNYKMGVLDGPAVATYTYAIKTTWYKNGVVQRTETKEIANNNNSKQSGNAVPEMITPVETTKKEPDLNEIVTYCEQMPSFKGGDAAFTKYLADSMRYPQAERDSMINGVVIMNFDVQKDGSITNVKAIRKVAGHPAFAEEAERLITNMPKWNPGKQDGKPVIVRMTHIIRFELK
jgi:TonB family protein